MWRFLAIASVIGLAASCAPDGGAKSGDLSEGKADNPGGAAEIDVVMSPQASATSHNARITSLIESAEHSIDIAIYSFSEAEISDALEDAVERGVVVRFIFETASSDRKLTGAALDASKSGRLEKAGIDVRWVNKIMHHKFIIVDGPRDDVDAAHTARMATGSANWNAGAERFDENTLFIANHAEIALRMQQEFNLMWHNARDIVIEEFNDDPSHLDIDDALLAESDDDDVDVHFTSSNYSVADSTFRIAQRDSVSTVLVEAIEDAESSIHIATGHLRLRPVAEALIARAEADPDLDIRIYLDGQEYLSSYSHSEQVADFEACLAEASTETQIRNCRARGFLFGYMVGEAPGIDVRYKYYAYRWDHSYAPQMHHKYMIIDGEDLYTGSYNFSDNAEHSSFENVLVFRGSAYQPLVAAFEANFEAIYGTAEGTDAYQTLMTQVASGEIFPIVFDPMALTHDEIAELKSAMSAACPAINSQDYRENAPSRRTCTP